MTELDAHLSATQLDVVSVYRAGREHTAVYATDESADSAVQTVNRRRSNVFGHSSTVLEQAS